MTPTEKNLLEMISRNSFRMGMGVGMIISAVAVLLISVIVQML